MRDDQIRPARMLQVQEAWDHGFDVLEPDVGGVVEALQRLNPMFGVRLGTRHHERAWVIFRKHCHAHPDYETDCPDCKMGQQRTFVTSRQAFQNGSGTWEGLTHEVVRHLERVGSESYNFAKEVERQNTRAVLLADQLREGAFAEHGEELAHAIRRDLGTRYRGRAFIHNKPDML